jgi:hypothetical protein
MVHDPAEQKPDLERAITVDSASIYQAARPTSPPQPIETSVPAATTSPPDDVSTSPSKRDSRMKSWFRGRFSSKSQNDSEVDGQPFNSTVPATSSVPVAAKISEDTEKQNDEEGLPRSDSMRDVALAGRRTRESEDTEDMYDASESQPIANDGPVSPVKETADPVQTRDRSPSISSLSSSDVEAAPASSAAATTTSTAVPVAASEPTKSSLEGTRTVDSEESRGRRGFRQRLLKKVKPSSSNSTNNNNNTTATPATTASSEQQNKTTGGGSFAGGLVSSSRLKKSAPTAGPTTNGNGPAAGSEAGVDKDTALAAEKEREKNSQDSAEREEARDTFAEESLAPPPKIGDRTEGSPKGSREGSRFREEL